MFEMVKENLEMQIKAFKKICPALNVTGTIWEQLLYKSLADNNLKSTDWNPNSHSPGSDMSVQVNNKKISLSCKSGLITTSGRKKDGKKLLYSFSSYRLTTQKNLPSKIEQILKINKSFDYYACIFRYANKEQQDLLKVCFIPSSLLNFTNIKFKQGFNKNSWDGSGEKFATKIRKSMSAQLWIYIEEDLISDPSVISFDIKLDSKKTSIKLIA